MLYFVWRMKPRKQKRYECVMTFTDVIEAVEYAVSISKSCNEPHRVRISDDDGRRILFIDKVR